MSMVVVPFPSEFPHKGEYPVWSKAWERAGYAPAPQYPGQMPITYPEDAALLEIQLGGYIRDAALAEAGEGR